MKYQTIYVARRGEAPTRIMSREELDRELERCRQLSEKAEPLEETPTVSHSF